MRRSPLRKLTSPLNTAAEFQKAYDERHDADERELSTIRQVQALLDAPGVMLTRTPPSPPSSTHKATSSSSRTCTRAATRCSTSSSSVTLFSEGRA